jgi:glycosyltransferase involved in cell wall biosynthesis
MASVVMSVYNSEQYLSESIKSILEQTFTAFEFIIINDGSTDESLDIIQKYMKKDARIVLINRENKGLPYSLNEGIERAKGKYIARMDADDISLPSRLEEQFKFMESNSDIGICGTWIESFGEGLKDRLMRFPADHEELKVILLFSVCFAHPTVMIRKKILDRNNLKYNLNYSNSQDYELWEKLSHVTKMGNLQKKLLRYRVSSNSITSIVDSKKNELRYQLVSKVFQQILYNLGMDSNEKNSRLHFMLGLNARISSENVDLLLLHLYFNSIIKMNETNNYLKKDYLVKHLSRKFLITCFYQAKKNNFKIILFLRYFFSFIYANIKCKVFG